MSSGSVEVQVLTYNQEQFISQCLNEILNQELDYDFQIVVTDDFSTDRTRAILKDYESKYPRKFKLYFNSENRSSLGLVPDIQALAASRSEFIAFCDGDDYWFDKNKLRRQTELLIGNSNIGLVHTNYLKRIESSHLEVNRSVDDEKKALKAKTGFDFIQGNDVKHSTVMIRRSELNVRLLESATDVIARDWLICVSACSRLEAIYLPEVTTVHRIHDQGTWNGSNVEARERIKEKVRWCCAANLPDGPLRDAFRRRVLLDLLRKNLRHSRIYWIVRPLVLITRKFLSR